MRVTVPVENVSKLLSGLERLAKRAAKIGCPVPTWQLGAEVAKERKNPDTGKVQSYLYREVEVFGEAPRFEGWRLVGVLQNLGEGNLLKMVPGEPAGLGDDYRTAKIECVHCKTARRRNETFLVAHDDGRLVQVGRQCLRDFLGHGSPEHLAEAAELLVVLDGLCADAEDEGWGGGGGRALYDLTGYLAMVACLIRRDGWLSRTAARGEGRMATADDALSCLDPTPDLRRLWQSHPETEPKPEAPDREVAEKAIEWATELPETSTDYLWNVRLVARFGYVDFKTAGIAASTIQAYRKAIGDEIKREAAASSEHFGEVGKRSTWTMTLTDRWDVDGYYGTTRIHKFLTDEGNVAIWFASKSSGIEVGETWKVKGTVKEHGVRKEVKQTILNRCVAVEKVETAA